MPYSGKNAVVYWSKSSEYDFLNSENKLIELWGGATYHLRFTVKAYESIQVEVLNGTTSQYNQAVAWSKIYGLSSITEASNTLFKPSMVFADQTSSVTNIKVTYSGAKKLVDTVGSLTLTDSDDSKAGTKDVYELLPDAEQGITMSEDEEYTFDMDYKVGSWNSGGKSWGFAFDLLDGNRAATARTDELILAAGIYILPFNGNNAVVYWPKSYEYAQLYSEQIALWGGSTYHLRFTVKAYESIQVEVFKGTTSQYNQTVAWSKIYGLSNITEASNTVFKPSMIFVDQTSTVDNIKCTYIKKAPVIGTKGNLANGKTVPTSFSGTENVALELGRIFENKANASWYYSGTFSYSQLAESEGGLHLIFGEGTYDSGKKDLTVAAQAVKTEGEVTGTKVVVKAGDQVLSTSDSTVKYGTATDYKYTVMVSSHKVSFWIDDTLLVEKFDLAGAGVTDITPKFGMNANGTAGTISDIKVWGDIEISTRPVMGEEDTNFAEGKVSESTTVAANEWKSLNLGKLKAKSNDAAWYYSGTFRYTSLPGANAMGGLAVQFGQGTINGAKRDLYVTARPVMNGSGNVKETQIVVWYKNANNNLEALGSFVKGNSATLYAKDTDYIFTVKASRTGKLSFWINDTRWWDDIDISGLVTDITPKFGFRGDGSAAAVSGIQVWGDLEQVNPAVKPDNAANLLSEAGTITEFGGGTAAYYNNEKVTVEGNSWYYSGKFEYTTVPTWGGLQFIFGTGAVDNTHTSPITGTRELSVQVRNSGSDKLAILWVDSIDTGVRGNTSGVTLEKGKQYTWTVEVTDGKLTFWIDNILVFDEYDLAACGITDVKPWFGFKADGSSGTLANAQVWDNAGTEEVIPVFATTDTNTSLFDELKVTAATGRLQYAGITYGDSYAYTADIAAGNADEVRLILGKSGEATVEVYYKENKAMLVKHSSAGDEEIASAMVAEVPPVGTHYTVKNNKGTISFWVNGTLVLQHTVENFTAGAGVAASGTGTVSNIKLWGDVTRGYDSESQQEENTDQSIIWQQFYDISPYRGTTNTYPQAVGYVFAGWYTNAEDNKDNALSSDVKTGSAYAKFVPDEVLSVKAQIGKDTTYASTEATRLRFVTTVDSLNYSEISFDVTYRTKQQKLTGTSVYRSIKASAEENAYTYAPTYFHNRSAYFYTYSITNIPASAFDDGFTVVPRWTTLDGTEVAGAARDIAVNDSSNYRITTKQLGNNGLGGSKLLQIRNKNSAQAMSYVIEAYNSADSTKPYVIVIDGGEAANADYLEWLLTKRYGGKVDAWFITHAHAGNYEALKKMLENGKIGEGEGQIAITNLYYNFPDSVESANITNFTTAVSGYTYLKAEGKVVEPQAGTQYTYGAVTITILSDCDAYYTNADRFTDGTGNGLNNASILMLAEFANPDPAKASSKVLFLGDMGEQGVTDAWRQAQTVMSEKSISLDHVTVQVASYGWSGVIKAFYDTLKPGVFLWPSKACPWENGTALADLKQDSTEYKHLDLYQFLVRQGYTTHYTAANGSYEFY